MHFNIVTVVPRSVDYFTDFSALIKLICLTNSPLLSQCVRGRAEKLSNVQSNGIRGPGLGTAAVLMVTLILFLGFRVFHRRSLPLSDLRTSSIVCFLIIHPLGRADSHDEESNHDQRQGNKKTCTEGRWCETRLHGKERALGSHVRKKKTALNISPVFVQRDSSLLQRP